MNSSLSLSAAELARQIRSGARSSVSVVDAHIERVRALNGPINAVVATCYDLAREEARAADLLVSRAKPDDTLPPLLGVPFTVKEFIAATGMPNTGGLRAHAERRGEKDATVVRRLKEAGAILLGVTNASEGGFWMESNNPIYGRTQNPWNLRHTAGGSSGGEGATQAFGGSAFGLGSDIGGSVRIPAAFNGVFGHKPTGGLVPLTGHHPGASERGPVLCIGPLGRSAEDLHVVLKVIAGPDGEDHSCLDYPLGDPSLVRPEDVTVYTITRKGAARFRPSMRRAIDEAGAALSAAGCKVVPIEVSGLRMGAAMWSARLMKMEGPGFAEILGGKSGKISVVKEILRFLFGGRRHSGPALLLTFLEEVGKLLPLPNGRFVKKLDELRIELETLMGTNAVLLHPPYTRPAPRHNAALSTPLDFACTGVFNVLEFPATVVPTGFDGNGLPLSVQIIGGRGQDHLTIAVAGFLERATGGWKRAELKS